MIHVSCVVFEMSEVIKYYQYQANSGMGILVLVNSPKVGWIQPVLLMLIIKSMIF